MAGVLCGWSALCGVKLVDDPGRETPAIADGESGLSGPGPDPLVPLRISGRGRRRPHSSARAAHGELLEVTCSHTAH